MKWFKHYSDASQGESLKLVMDEFGHMGLSCYWLLLEDCARTWRDPDTPPKFKKSLRTLREVLRIRSTSVQLLLNFYQTVNLLEFKDCGKFFEIYIPKMAEIKDNHLSNLKATKKQLESNLTPRGKSTDIRDNKSTEEEKKTGLKKAVPVALPKLADLWNQYAHQTLPRVDSVSPKTPRGKNCSARWKEKPDEEYWIKVIERMNNAPYCLGYAEKYFKASFTWFVRPDKHVEILEGKYDRLFMDKHQTRGQKAAEHTRKLINNNPFLGSVTPREG